MPWLLVLGIIEAVIRGCLANSWRRTAVGDSTLLLRAAVRVAIVGGDWDVTWLGRWVGGGVG